ncbi:MAG TPA: hypothetical protein DDZ51_00515 [Planctomycetaceae bacterium]|nr:hypothetical protein [Planctomycetaceae bacterium]
MEAFLCGDRGCQALDSARTAIDYRKPFEVAIIVRKLLLRSLAPFAAIGKPCLAPFLAFR